MRIRLNDRSLSQLNEVMRLLGVTNPTNTVQTMITTLLKSMNDQSLNEDNSKYDNQSSKGVRSMYN